MSRGVEHAVVSPAEFYGKWEETGAVLDKIIVFPMKSGKGIEVQEAEVTKMGLKVPGLGGARDREFVLFEEVSVEDGGEGEKRTKLNMLTARRYPQMQLVEVDTVEKEGGGGRRVLKLAAPGMEDLEVDLDAELLLRGLDVFGSLCQGLDLGEATGDWFREFLLGAESGKKLRLFWHGAREDASRKAMELMERIPAFNTQDLPRYADATPFLLLSNESVSRIAEEVDSAAGPASSCDTGEEVFFRRFRANLMVKGEKEPFQEDRWMFVRVGETAALRCMLLCPRCEMVTIDPETGSKTRGGEPLKTLNTFRVPSDAEERKVLGPLLSTPMVGNMCAMETPGVVAVGDKIWAQMRKE